MPERRAAAVIQRKTKESMYPACSSIIEKGREVDGQLYPSSIKGPMGSVRDGVSR